MNGTEEIRMCVCVCAFFCSKTHYTWRMCWRTCVRVFDLSRARKEMLCLKETEKCVSITLIIYTVSILNLTFLHAPCSAMMYWFITKHIKNIVPPRCVCVRECIRSAEVWSYFRFILLMSSSHLISSHCLLLTGEISFDVLHFILLMLFSIFSPPLRRPPVGCCPEHWERHTPGFCTKFLIT